MHLDCCQRKSTVYNNFKLDIFFGIYKSHHMSHHMKYGFFNLETTFFSNNKSYLNKAFLSIYTFKHLNDRGKRPMCAPGFTRPEEASSDDSTGIPT